MPKHLSLASNELALAVMENLEDGVADVIAHHKDRRVGDGKSSTITIKVILTPNQPRDRLGLKVTRDVNLAKRDSEGWDGRIFVRYDDEGEVVEVSDLDPRQMRLDMSRE